MTHIDEPDAIYSSSTPVSLPYGDFGFNRIPTDDDRLFGRPQPPRRSPRRRPYRWDR